MSKKRPITPIAPPLSPLQPPISAMPAVWKWISIAIVGAYIAFTLVHLNITPVLSHGEGSLINAPDETAHLGYIKILATEGRLPGVSDRDVTYEWHQPPFYYLVASLFYPAGTKAVRLFSLLCGLAGLIFIAEAGRKLFPNEPALAVASMGFAALLPMRHAITSAAGNDAMTEAMFSLTLLLLIYAFHGGLTSRRALYIGIALSVTVLTKATGLLLCPIVLLALAMMWREGETSADVLRGAIIIFGILVVSFAPWALRNHRLYGEFTPVKAFAREFEGTSKAGDWIGQRRLTVEPISGSLVPSNSPMTRGGYLSLLCNWTYRTFWASYTTTGQMASQGIPLFPTPAFYLLPTILLVAALYGLVRLHPRRNIEFTSLQRRVVVLLMVVFVLVSTAFAGFTWVYFQAQGRYLYPTMLPMTLLFALGIRGAFPTKHREKAYIGALSILAILSLAFITGCIMPAYSQ